MVGRFGRLAIYRFPLLELSRSGCLSVILMFNLLISTSAYTPVAQHHATTTWNKVLRAQNVKAMEYYAGSVDSCLILNGCLVHSKTPANKTADIRDTDTVYSSAEFILTKNLY